jgi:glycosyltransferase involved in cell wall biosynthesis
MHVVMIITEFYPHIGGAQRQLALLGRELQATGVGAQVLTAHFHGLARQDTVNGLPVVRLSSPGRGGRWSKWGNMVFLAHLTIWLVKHHSEYDIVHTHVASVAACLAVGIGRVLGKGTVVKVANSGPYSDFRRSLGRHGFLDRLFLDVLRQADVIVSISSRVREDLVPLDFKPSQIVDIPNGVELTSEDIFTGSAADLRQWLGLPEGLLALCVASLHPKKGLDVLIQAWQRVKTVISQAKLVILGEGSERAGLETLVMESNLTGQVYLPGQVENVTQYLQAADLFILPSRAEGLSNALLEAMAMGLPVVATAVGGTSDVIVHGENGLLIPPEDEVTLGEAIISLLQDPALRECLGRAAHCTVKTQYAISSVAARYLELYQTLVER